MMNAECRMNAAGSMSQFLILHSAFITLHFLSMSSQATDEHLPRLGRQRLLAHRGERLFSRGFDVLSMQRAPRDVARSLGVFSTLGLPPCQTLQRRQVFLVLVAHLLEVGGELRL